MGLLYFARDGEGHIKIGYSEMPGPRLRVHEKLVEGFELLGTMEGDGTTDKLLREGYRHSRISTDWFQPDPNLLTFIQESSLVVRETPTFPHTLVKVYGPYVRRIGNRLYEYERHIFEDGSSKTVHLGPVGDAYAQGPVTVEVPRDLEEDLALAYTWSKSYYFARVYKPLGRLLRLMKTRLRTDEVVP